MVTKNSPQEAEGDPEFIESLDHLEDLPPIAQATEGDEDFDFDGHDVPLNAIPSWIEDEEQTINVKEGYTFDESEDLLSEKSVPDTSELFNAIDPSAGDDLKAAIEQRDSYLEALRQLQADFENYKKRVIRDQQEYAEMKNVKLMEELLPIIDNFDLALQALDPKDSTTKKLRKGIELVYAELFALLEKQGLEKINAQGALFDPEYHDAVSHEDNGEHEQEVVTEVLREGYVVRGRVVRPAMVKVAK